MTDAIQKHLLKYPHSRPKSLLLAQIKAEKTAQLQAEIAARNPIPVPERKSIIHRFISRLRRHM